MAERIDIANADLYDAEPEGFDVYSWSPTPAADVAAGKPQAPSTQVHLYASTPLQRMMWRFKGPGTLDRLIAALIHHRVHVFGQPSDHKVWLVHRG